MAKKTKKVETPIDQRETFVSIQKSFADSDLSVEEKLRTLYELQQADTEIDKILQLRGELPLEVEALENEIADLKAKTARINEQIDDAGKRITEYKHNIVECDTQLDVSLNTSTISSSAIPSSKNTGHRWTMCPTAASTTPLTRR